jgi:eukaryotic-like serine/threonine-protein kinase
LNSESTRTQAAPAHQERLARILDEYLVAIEQGHGLSPEELLAKHPEDAAQLRGYLSGLNLFHAVAGSPTQMLAGIAKADIGIPPALQTIGDYRLVREIGRGGMGVVYEAWQVSLRRRVALKVLPFTSAHDAKQIGRFKNEAQAAAQVQHPNIVPVFAIGEENGVHYYVMQLIDGQSLTSLLDALRTGGNGPCDDTLPNNELTYNSRRASGSPESSTHTTRSNNASAPMRAGETADHVQVVARMGIQAAGALYAAHEYGIVHRDVKPSNLLLDDQGKLWVTDFGLARCRENQGLTQTGDVLGTMRYMSPEQAQGRAALVDQRTDIYSLGLTMYELATLNHPADEEGEFQVFDRNRQAPKPLRQWNRHIPSDFQTIVLKCVAEFPQERYTTAKELSDTG